MSGRKVFMGWGMRKLLGSIALRFALVSLLPIAVLGWVLDSAVRDAIEERAGEVYGGMTSLMFRMTANYLVTAEDFASDTPLPAEREAFIESLLTGFGADDDDVRVIFAAPDGRVVYANRDADRSQPVDVTDAFSDALRGERRTIFTRDGSPGFDAGQRIIELYLPVRIGSDPTVHGVVVASGIDGSIIKTIDRDVRRMQLSLLVGLGALWVVLLPISSSVSRRLRKKSEENEYLALHDTLTDLPNRNLLALRLAEEIETARRTGGGVGLLLVDLDRFKEVNDTLGHGKGDELLIAVAERLRGTVRDEDMVARLGGDEFAVVVHDARSPADVEVVARRVLAGLTGPTDIGGVRIAVQASIGGALFPHEARDAGMLLQHADVAMYAAKDGSHGFALYRSELDSHSPSRLALAAELLRALERDEFVLHYQPVASPLTGEVDGAEALVRWEHPTRGLLPPSEFIPLAEQSGLIRDLTTRVLDKAVAQAAAWRRDGLEIVVSVNLSANDLRSPAIVQEVAMALARHRLPAHLLELEVTETALLDAPDVAALVVSHLRALGTLIALDDFGTGYSSLTYLKQLAPDRLKIDRSFVNSMLMSDADAEIVRSVIDLAHRLAIGVTAEGVESQEQWDLLAGLSCDLVQGYHLSRPASPEVLTMWLRSRRRSLLPADVSS